MHRKSNALLALVLMVVMFALALGIGAYKGWSNQWHQVQEAEHALHLLLVARKEVGNNLMVVASRHLNEKDEGLITLQKAVQVLADERATLVAKTEADAQLKRTGEDVLARLLQLPSLQQDERDRMYVQSLLPQALAQSDTEKDKTLYNKRADAYNQDLNSHISGRIARLLGIGQANPLPTQSGGTP